MNHTTGHKIEQVIFVLFLIIIFHSDEVMSVLIANITHKRKRFNSGSDTSCTSSVSSLSGISDETANGLFHRNLLNSICVP